MSGSPAADRGQRLTGIGLFIATILAFGVMDALIKHLSAQYGTWQIIFFRAVFALVPLAFLVAWSGGPTALRTKRPLAHVLRAAVSATAVFCFFYSFAHLPMADVYAISFASPLMLTALSVPLLGEKVGWRRWAAVIVGFAGVVVMLNPGAGMISPVALVALAGTFFYSLTLIYVRHLSRTETDAAIVFYFMSTLGVIGGIAMIPDWVTPDGVGLMLLIATGLVGGVAQILLTRAFRLAPPMVLAPFEYTGMIWATLFGFFIFGDVPGMNIWIGSAIVIASGLYILWREARVGKTVSPP